MQARNEVPQRARLLNATVFSFVAIPFLSIVAQFLREIQHAHTPTLRFNTEVSEPASILESPASPECQTNESSKRVISMSLFGSIGKYTTGALRNAEKMPTVYPGCERV
jgi:hypothetical protein